MVRALTRCGGAAFVWDKIFKKAPLSLEAQVLQLPALSRGRKNLKPKTKQKQNVRTKARITNKGGMSPERLQTATYCILFMQP